MVAVDVLDTVAGGQIAGDAVVLDLRIGGDDHLLTEEIVVDKFAVVVVVIADEVHDVALLDGDQAADHLLDAQVAAGAVLDDLRARDVALRRRVVEGDDEVDVLVVEERGDVADDAVLVVVVFDGGQVVERGGIAVDAQPRPVVFANQVEVVVKVEQRVEAEVDKALAVVDEDVELHRFDQLPLVVGELEDVLPRAVGRPVELLRVDGAHVLPRRDKVAGERLHDAVAVAGEQAAELRDHAARRDGGRARAGAAGAAARVLAEEAAADALQGAGEAVGDAVAFVGRRRDAVEDALKRVGEGAASAERDEDDEHDEHGDPHARASAASALLVVAGAGAVVIAAAVADGAAEVQAAAAPRGAAAVFGRGVPLAASGAAAAAAGTVGAAEAAAAGAAAAGRLVAAAGRSVDGHDCPSFTDRA